MIRHQRERYPTHCMIGRPDWFLPFACLMIPRALRAYGTGNAGISPSLTRQTQASISGREAISSSSLAL